MRFHFKFSNNYPLKLLSALFITMSSTYASLEYELIYGEKGSNKIRLFFFAEGFDELHKNDYKNIVKSFVDTLFSVSPYKEYKNLFTAYRVWTPSLCSYVPSGQPSDSTFFGGSASSNGPPAMSQNGLKYFLDINVG
jgi:hypothetical protein